MSSFRTSPEVKTLIERARELEDGSIEKEKLETQLMFLCGFLFLHWYETDDGHQELPHDDSDMVDLGNIYAPPTHDSNKFALTHRTINL